MIEIKNIVNNKFMDNYELYELRAKEKTLSNFFELGITEDLKKMTPEQIIQIYELSRSKEMKNMYESLYDRTILKELR